MLLVDVTIVNVALPDKAKDLNTSFSSLQWVVDAYALILAALVLGTGSIADILGHRQTYVAGLALFAIASFTCGIAPNSGVLVASRAVQGLGGAAMFATTFALLNSNYSGRDRGTAYGIWGAVVGASAAIGPILGGLLTEGISWRWIFFVNLPVSVVAIAMCVLVIRDVHDTRQARVDWLGILTFTAAAAAITYGLIHANEYGWSEPASWAMFPLGAVLLALFVYVELHTADAMLDLGLLRRRAFLGIVLAAGLLTFAAFATFAYTSIWLQSVLGMSPIEAGSVGVAMSIAAFLVSAWAGRHLTTLRPGPVVGIGLLLVAAGDFLSVAFTHGGARWAALVPGFVVIGVGVGMINPSLNSTAMSAVPPQRGGMAAGAVNTSRQLGFAFGIALLGSVFSARIESVLRHHDVANAAKTAHLVSGGQAGRVLAQAPASGRAHLDTALHAATVSAVQYTFLVAGVIGAIAGLLVLWLVDSPKPTHHQAPSPAEQKQAAEPLAATD
jgi:EmrB/QacA subfamily drug resistance transporter